MLLAQFIVPWALLCYVWYHKLSTKEFQGPQAWAPGAFQQQQEPDSRALEPCPHLHSEAQGTIQHMMDRTQQQEELRIIDTSDPLVNKSSGSDGSPLVAVMPRFADEQPFGPNPQSNTPGVQDIYTELHEYVQKMVLTTFVREYDTATDRQHRELLQQKHETTRDGTAHSKPNIDTTIQFINMMCQKQMKTSPHVAIATTTSIATLPALALDLLPWLQYHLEMGVSKFYILYDGINSTVVQYLHSIECIDPIHIHPPWATAREAMLWDMHFDFSIREVQLKGNYVLMAKQGYCLQEALARARQAAGGGGGGPAPAWLLHLDPDELFLPHTYPTIAEELAAYPAHIPAVRFLNFEAQAVYNDLVANTNKGADRGGDSRFDAVTMFRVHKHFITPGEAFHYRHLFSLGLLLYANGKSAVRVDAPGVRHAGPHYFTGDSSERWVHNETNPNGAWYNAVSDGAVVLHYAYATAKDVEDKAGRTTQTNDCYDAAKGELVHTKECFVIDFDAQAFAVAAKQHQKRQKKDKSDDDDVVRSFFNARLLLSNGRPVPCNMGVNDTVVSGWCGLVDVDRFIHLMEKLGVLRRIVLPRIVLKMHAREMASYTLS